jgi:DNA invertase Pin-like site-specific DNA recombinase
MGWLVKVPFRCQGDSGRRGSELENAFPCYILGRQTTVWIPSMAVHYGNFVSYYRVSTDRQGRSGLGLEAQKEAVEQRLNGGRWQLIAEFVEIESGKRAKRPKLDAALAVCKKQKAKLVVAKLDRLSRNVTFLLKLIDSGVEVLFADLPELNGAMGRFMLTTMASVAELEAGLISERTMAALKAAKARGVKLGRHGAEVLAPKYREEARQRARELEPVITKLKDEGFSMARMATELNKRKVPTPRGGRWDHSSVRNVMQRLSA